MSSRHRFVRTDRYFSTLHHYPPCGRDTHTTQIPPECVMRYQELRWEGRRGATGSPPGGSWGYSGVNLRVNSGVSWGEIGGACVGRVQGRLLGRAGRHHWTAVGQERARHSREGWGQGRGRAGLGWQLWTKLAAVRPAAGQLWVRLAAGFVAGWAVKALLCPGSREVTSGGVMRAMGDRNPLPRLPTTPPIPAGIADSPQLPLPAFLHCVVATTYKPACLSTKGEGFSRRV